MKKTVVFLIIIITIFSCISFTGCKKKEDLTSYYLDLSYNEEEHKLYGKMSVDFFNDKEVVFKEIKFNTFGNAFRKDAKYFPVLPQYTAKAYPNGINYGEMSISNVTVDEKVVDFYIGGEDLNLLTVPLEEELFPNERVKIEMEFCLKLANVHARTGYNDKTVNLGNFYPVLAVYENAFLECNYYAIGDPFYSETANYTVSIKTPKEFVVASSGKLVKSKETNGIVENSYVLKNARDFALVLSKEFEVVTKKVGETEINYYYYDDNTPENELKTASLAIETFSNKFTNYPYESYSVCQTKFFEGGMEYPGLVYISDGLEEQSFNEVIVHETAHQWWYGLVGNNQIEYGFLDEGLAEYSVILFYEDNKEYGLKRETLVDICEQNYQTFCTVYDKLFGNVNTSMRNLKDYKSEYEYVNLSYVKPSIMFDRLRRDIGDKRFFSSLKGYCEENQYKIATPDDLIYAFSKSGVDVESYFRSFIDGKVIL
ncbi:MAG: M1 family metallopeptidase [Clostridiales bacterium]|nr:M1 family metallopeptidase [Clostridiales bacterium]